MNITIDKRGIKLLNVLADLTEDAVVGIDSSIKLNDEPIICFDESDIEEKVFDMLYSSSEPNDYSSKLSINEYTMRDMCNKLFPGLWEKVVEQHRLDAEGE